jgi:hypothetical protein
MWHAWVMGEVFTGFLSGDPNENDKWEDLGITLR